MNKDYESILEQIKKVKELAERGIGGEKENAKILLDKLLKKYNISFNEVNNEEKDEYIFNYKTNFDEKILIQCLLKYSKSDDYLTYKQENKIKIKLTKLEWLDVEASYDFYKNLFSKEIDLLFTAFINKHDIFREKNPNDNSKGKELSEQEMESLINMMKGLSNNSFIPTTRKQIDKGKND